MKERKENLKNTMWIAGAFIFIVVLVLVWYFFGKIENTRNIKDQTYNPTIPLEQKDISENSKEVLIGLGEYANNNPVMVDDFVQDEIQGLSYTPENGVDGREVTEEQKEVVVDKKLKTASELGVTEEQREYVLRSISDARLVFDDYYTSQFDQFFINPEEYEEIKEKIILDYQDVHPEKWNSFVDSVQREAVNYVRREMTKYSLGKNDPAIIQIAQELGVDLNDL